MNEQGANSVIMFSLSEIVEATGGTIITPPDCARIHQNLCYGVSTDTRNINPGDLFVALTGERFDGHSFVDLAAGKGAGLALISRRVPLPETMTGILVNDTLLALQALARAYRRKLSCRVIAVTGSVGKTSTRELLYYAFSKTMRTHATRHNLNNEIGLPLTILTAPRDTELMILEMGMRMRGEIQTLSLIAEPDIAVITNIGVSHIERLGSRDEIRDAKLEILEGLRNDGILLYSGSDEYLAPFLRNGFSDRTFRVGEALDEGSKDDLFSDWTVQASSVQYALDTTSFLAEIRSYGEDQMRRVETITIPAVGLHHVKNAMFAVLAALVMDIPLERVVQGLMEYHPTGSRSKIIRTEPYLLIDDAYNASPESMKAAFSSLQMLAAKENRRPIAALGCVLELGSYAGELHQSIGRAAAEAGIDSLYLYGDDAQNIAIGAHMVRPDMNVKIFPSRENLIGSLLQDIRPGDAVLAKGSHAFAMEKVIEAILTSLRETPEEAR